MDPISSGGPALPVVSLDAWKRDLRPLEPNVESPEVILRKDEYAAVVRDGMKDESTRTLDFIISTASVDREGDTIAVEGWKLTNYRKNPVVLWAHNYRSLPIGKAKNIRAADGKLMAEAVFASGELNPLAESVYQMCRQGFLNATSVGFRPIKHVRNDERGPWAIDFMEQELLEYSVVPVPANAEALQLAAKSGIDLNPVKLWCVEFLDAANDEPMIVLPRSTAERAWKLATGESRSFLAPAPPKAELEGLLDESWTAKKEKADAAFEEQSDLARKMRESMKAEIELKGRRYADEDSQYAIAAPDNSEQIDVFVRAGDPIPTYEEAVAWRERAKLSSPTPPAPDPQAAATRDLAESIGLLADSVAELKSLLAGGLALAPATVPTLVAPIVPAPTRREADPKATGFVLDLTDPAQQRELVEAFAAVADQSIADHLRRMSGRLPN